MFQSLLNKINLQNRLTVSVVGGFSIAFAIFLTIYVIILPSDKTFDATKDSSLVDFVRLRKNDFLNERERVLPDKPPPPKKYTIIAGKTQAYLEQEVRKMMKLGWQPFGGVSAAAFGVSPVGGNQYIQAMVQY